MTYSSMFRSSLLSCIAFPFYVLPFFWFLSCNSKFCFCSVIYFLCFCITLSLFVFVFWNLFLLMQYTLHFWFNFMFLLSTSFPLQWGFVIWNALQWHCQRLDTMSCMLSEHIALFSLYIFKPLINPTARCLNQSVLMHGAFFVRAPFIDYISLPSVQGKKELLF